MLFFYTSDRKCISHVYNIFSDGMAVDSEGTGTISLISFVGVASPWS